MRLALVALAMLLAACGAGGTPEPTSTAPATPTIPDFTVVRKELLNMGSPAATARFTVVLRGRETVVDVALVLRHQCIDVRLGAILPPDCR